MSERYEWFDGLESVPGISWTPLVPVDVSRLCGARAWADVERGPDFQGRPRLSVEWRLGTRGARFGGSGSPAHQHEEALASEEDLAPRDVARRVSEALAMPGTRSDYHFTMMAGWERLYSARQEEPSALRWVEALCLADVLLIELGPELVFPEHHWLQHEDTYPVFPAFERLSSLYQREGFLSPAVEIEYRCAALGSPRAAGDDALARRTALLEEDGR